MADCTTFPYTTLFRSENNKRAADSLVDEALIRTEQFRKGSAASDDVATLKKQSISYFKGLRTEEHTSELQTHVNDVTRLKHKTISYYENNKRATDSLV